MNPVLKSKSLEKGTFLYIKNSVRNQMHAKNILLFAYQNSYPSLQALFISIKKYNCYFSSDKS